MKTRNRSMIEPPTNETELLLWSYIHENVCKSSRFRRVDAKLMKEFMILSEVSGSPKHLLDYYEGCMVPALYKAEIDKEVMLDLYKTLEFEIPPHAEAVLEKQFNVGLRVDSKRRLVDFKLFGQRPEKASTPKNVTVKNEVMTPSPSSKAPSEAPLESPAEASPEENTALDEAIWTHIGEQFHALTPNKLMSAKFWMVMFDTHRLPTRSYFTAQRHFVTKLLDDLWKQPLKPTSRKLQMLRTLDVQLNEEQKRWIEENEAVDLELDEEGFVLTWKFEEGESEEDDIVEPPPEKRSRIATWQPLNKTASTSRGSPNRESRSPSPSGAARETPRRPAKKPHEDSRNPSHFRSPSLKVSAKRMAFTLEDDVNAWKYIIKEVYDDDVDVWDFGKTELKGEVFWKEFIKKTKSDRTVTNWCSHYRKVMCKNLYKMPLPILKKLNLYFFLRLPVSEKAQRGLEAEGNVKVTLDSNEVIARWDWLDENGQIKRRSKKIVDE